MFSGRPVPIWDENRVRAARLPPPGGWAEQQGAAFDLCPAPVGAAAPGSLPCASPVSGRNCVLVARSSPCAWSWSSMGSSCHGDLCMWGGLRWEPFYKPLHQRGERKDDQVVLLKGGARKPPGPPWGCKSCVRVEASHPEQEGEPCHLCGSPSQPAGVCLEWTGPAGSTRLVLVQPGWELVWVEPRRMWGWEQRWEGPDVSGRLSCLQKSCE